MIYFKGKWWPAIAGGQDDDWWGGDYDYSDWSGEGEGSSGDGGGGGLGGELADYGGGNETEGFYGLDYGTELPIPEQFMSVADAWDSMFGAPGAPPPSFGPSAYSEGGGEPSGFFGGLGAFGPEAGLPIPGGDMDLGYSQPTAPQSQAAAQPFGGLPSWEQYRAGIPAVDQRGNTAWWNYNAMLAEQHPNLPAVAGIYGGVGNIPSFVDPGNLPYNVQGQGLADYDTLMSDMEKYGKAFNVGGPGYVLPGGSMVFGPNRAYQWDELVPSTSHPEWARTMMEGRGYLWNPYQNSWEQRNYNMEQGNAGGQMPRPTGTKGAPNPYEPPRPDFGEPVDGGYYTGMDERLAPNRFGPDKYGHYTGMNERFAPSGVIKEFEEQLTTIPSFRQEWETRLSDWASKGFPEGNVPKWLRTWVARRSNRFFPGLAASVGLTETQLTPEDEELLAELQRLGMV